MITITSAWKNADYKTFIENEDVKTNSVFKFDGSIQFETVANRLTQMIPDGYTFEFEGVAPGTELYTLVGHSAMIVTLKTAPTP
jgi:hypothetical protein